MSADWQVGDLAVCVDASTIECPHLACGYSHFGNTVAEGRSYRVAAVSPWHCGCTVLVMDNGNGGLVARFRKIRPDEHEACEPEFVTLLKRAKQPNREKAQP